MDDTGMTPDGLETPRPLPPTEQFQGGRRRRVRAADPRDWGVHPGAVELVAQRTEHSKTFAVPGSRYTTIISADLHTVDTTGDVLVAPDDAGEPHQPRPAAAPGPRPRPARLGGSTNLQEQASADDGQVYCAALTYPPLNAARLGASGSTKPTVQNLTATTMSIAAKNRNGTTYEIINGLYKFPTNLLPTNATFSTVFLEIPYVSKQSTNNRSLVAEWYDAGAAIDAKDYSEAVPTSSEPNFAGSSLLSAIPMITGRVSLGLTNTGNINVAGSTWLRMHINGSTPTGLNSVDGGTFDNATPSMRPYLACSYTSGITGRTTPAAYVATMNSAGTATATAQPGAVSSTSRRTTARFPVMGEAPRLARITKVELLGTVTVVGGTSAAWQINEYAPADPEVDTFPDQFTGAASFGRTLASGISGVWKSLGAFRIDLGANGIAMYKDRLLNPFWGYFPIGIIETNAGTTAAFAAPTLTGLSLFVTYEIPTPTTTPIYEQAAVSLLTSAIPPRVAELDLREYAAEFTVRWQGPGSGRLVVPMTSRQAQKLEDMGLVDLRIGGVPICSFVQESTRVVRSAATGRYGAMLEVRGQTLHRFLGNRITGPFPAGFNHDAASMTTMTGKTEVFAAGDASPRGSTFGAASQSAESVTRKMLKTHTVGAASTSRITAWTANIQLAPDGRRGASPIEVRTELKPVLAEAEAICQKADCGYTVLLDQSGYFDWHFLPGVDRTQGEGAWFWSPDLTRGVEEVTVERDVTQLVTHAYVVSPPPTSDGSGTEATYRRLSVRSQSGSDQYDRREVAVDASSAQSANAAALVGDGYLAQHTGAEKVSLSLNSLLDSGWLTAFEVGDLILVGDPDTGVTSPVRIYEITVTLGTESMVRALAGDPSVQPLLNARAKRLAAGRRAVADPFVALVSVVTAPAPAVTPESWKLGAAPGGFPDGAYLPGLTAPVTDLNNTTGMETAATRNPMQARVTSPTTLVSPSGGSVTPPGALGAQTVSTVSTPTSLGGQSVTAAATDTTAARLTDVQTAFSNLVTHINSVLAAAIGTAALGSSAQTAVTNTVNHSNSAGTAIGNAALATGVNAAFSTTATHINTQVKAAHDDAVTKLVSARITS